MSARLAFVTNLPSHFHTGLFETIAANYDTDFFFFSDGTESWIERGNELKFGRYRGEFVRGFKLSRRFRINVQLVMKLTRGNYDVIIQAINGRFELPASFLVSRLRGKPFILWTNLWHHPRTIVHLVGYPFVRFVYRNADALVTYGPHIAKYLESIGVQRDRIFNSYNVIDNKMFGATVPRERLAYLKQTLSLEGRKVLLFVGRLTEEKGLRYLMEAFSSLPASLKATLILVGRGEMRHEIDMIVKSKGIAHVLFLDYVPNRELNSFYALADALILPSITTRTFKEPWGIVINEAMNQGCPVITTNAVGAAMAGVVEHGKNGFIIPEKNSHALKEALINLLSDDSKRAQMRRYAKESITRWDYAKSFCGFKDAIDYVLAKRKEAYAEN
jgi:glycosyltransferase involved in cell wall biosynthesis